MKLVIRKHVSLELDDERYVYMNSGVPNTIIRVYENAFDDFSSEHISEGQLKLQLGEKNANKVLKALKRLK